MTDLELLDGAWVHVASGVVAANAPARLKLLPSATDGLRQYEDPASTLVLAIYAESVPLPVDLQLAAVIDAIARDRTALGPVTTMVVDDLGPRRIVARLRIGDPVLTVMDIAAVALPDGNVGIVEAGYAEASAASLEAVAVRIVGSARPTGSRPAATSEDLEQ